MISLSTDSILQPVQASYPFPIAFVLKTEVLDASTPRD